jgi:hypothetical protein
MKLHFTNPRFYSGAWHKDDLVSDSEVWANVGRVLLELFRRIIMWKW